jgi:hypothetical protein
MLLVVVVVGVLPSSSRRARALLSTPQGTGGPHVEFFTPYVSHAAISGPPCAAGELVSAPQARGP